MLCASVADVGEFLRCQVCGGPGAVAVTDLPDSLRERRSVVIWCRRDAEEQLPVIRRLAEHVRDEGMRTDALHFARAVRSALDGG